LLCLFLFSYLFPSHDQAHNVNNQCNECNCYKGGAFDEYEQGLILKIGQEAVDELHAKSKIVHKWTKEELQVIINKYK